LIHIINGWSAINLGLGVDELFFVITIPVAAAASVPSSLT